MSSDETTRLERVASWFSTEEGFQGRLIGYGLAAITPHFVGDSCLELGPADGHMTGTLLERFAEVTSVDGSEKFCQALRDRFPDHSNFRVECSLFEDYKPAHRFDTIVAGHILEHVADPVEVLTAAVDWIAPGGRLIILVPNAWSLHRRVAVKMGLLGDVHELNELDDRLGHRRVYDPELLLADVTSAGWQVVTESGVFLKPLSNAQIEDWFTPEMMDGFAAVAADFPQLSGEILFVCEPRR